MLIFNGNLINIVEIYEKYVFYTILLWGDALFES